MTSLSVSPPFRTGGLEEEALGVFRVLHLADRFGVVFARSLDPPLAGRDFVGEVQGEEVRFFLVAARRLKRSYQFMFP